MSLQMMDNVSTWVGGIPEGWNLVKLKHVATKLNRPVNRSDEMLVCTNKGQVTPRGEKGAGLVSLTENGYQGVRPGDLLVHGMDTWHGAIAVSDLPGKCTSVVHVCDSSEDKRYIAYYLRALSFRGVYKAFSNGVRQNTSDFRSWPKAGVIPVIIPPFEEQRRIANFLDEKCAEIDKAMASAEASIEDCKAYREAKIMYAITGGLSTEETKCSDVGWIGDVPVSWDVVRQKYVMSFTNGRAYKQEELLNEGKYRVVRVGNFKTNNSWYYSNMELDESKYCNAGDLMYLWSTTFGPAFWEGEKAIYHYHIWKVDLKDSINKQFAFYALEAESEFQRAQTHGFTLAHITKAGMESSFIPIPPMKEQTQIADYLDTKCAEIAKIIEAKQSIINDLRAYKQSLIYETVTGKRGV